MRIVMTWGLSRRPPAERQALLTVAQQAQDDVERQKEVILMGQTIAEEIWEEGRLKGRTEGALEASRSMLRRLLTKRFGTLPESVVQRIDNCTDLEQLSVAAEQILSLDEPESLQL
jgi:hypothetical protein